MNEYKVEPVSDEAKKLWAALGRAPNISLMSALFEDQPVTLAVAVFEDGLHVELLPCAILLTSDVLARLGRRLKDPTGEELPDAVE